MSKAPSKEIMARISGGIEDRRAVLRITVTRPRRTDEDAYFDASYSCRQDDQCPLTPVSEAVGSRL